MTVEKCPTTGLPMTPRLTIEPGWIDYNGHLNMAYYMVLMDRSFDVLFDSFGLGPSYIATRGLSFFAADATMRYLREVHVNDVVRARMRILGVDEKRVHYYAELFKEASGETCATMESVSLHVDMAVRRVTRFPDDVRATFEKARAEHDACGPARYAGHTVGLKRP